MIEEPTFMSFIRRPRPAALCAVLAAGSLALSAAPALAVNGGDAASLLGLRPGDAVRLEAG